mmetsp:Transcript_23070/g.75109  ORF Transcript_23070/g.75109 Transcript_23070/m.75109 type:complete len:261 (+) Transcript_23070:635-1417(+)
MLHCIHSFEPFRLVSSEKLEDADENNAEEDEEQGDENLHPSSEHKGDKRHRNGRDKQKPQPHALHRNAVCSGQVGLGVAEADDGEDLEEEGDAVEVHVHPENRLEALERNDGADQRHGYRQRQPRGSSDRQPFSEHGGQHSLLAHPAHHVGVLHHCVGKQSRHAHALCHSERKAEELPAMLHGNVDVVPVVVGRPVVVQTRERHDRQPIVEDNNDEDDCNGSREDLRHVCNLPCAHAPTFPVPHVPQHNHDEARPIGLGN